MDGPETAKLCGPYFDVLVRGTVRSPCGADRRHWVHPVLAATGTHISARQTQLNRSSHMQALVHHGALLVR